MKVRILGSAIHDLERGYSFYEKQEQGLGSYFLDSLFADIDSLQILAGIHSLHFGKYRFLAKRFPFAIYYSMEENSALIHAVLDCRQNPARTAYKLR
jgi:hypothetical protein